MARRYRSSGRRSSRGRSRKSGFGVNLSMPVLAGVAVGFSNLDDRLPKELVLGAAVAPIRGLGVVKSAAQGVIFGNLLQSYLGKTGSGISGGFNSV